MSEAAIVETADARAWSIFQAFLHTDEGRQAPEAFYPELHALGEQFLMPDGTRLVVGHAALSALMVAPHFIKGVGKGRYRPAYSRTTPEQDRELFELGSDVGPQLTASDPPDHTRMRAMVQAAFMPRYVRALEEVIPQEIDRLLSAINHSEPVDIIAAFSAKFAPEIMAHLIGLPSDRRSEVAALSAEFMRGIDPGVDFETRRASVLAGRHKRDIVREVIADRRAHPRDDLVSTLIAAVPERINEAELVALLQIMYLGGYETTSHMVGNGLVQLLRHPDQFAALGADPSLSHNAVAEILRLDSAISLTKFIAEEGAEVRGVAAEPGQIYLGLFGAANRDPNAFPEPDRFDIRRQGKNHLAFGAGIHFCLGVNLARFELEKVFSTFAVRFPRMRLVDPAPRRLNTFMQRAFEKVMVVLKP